MADAFILNQVPTGYGNALWLLINMLRSAGWTIQASGDGLAAYSSSSSVFSGAGATGANGFGNARAWARMQDPAAGREFIIQSSNTGNIRIKYSPSAKFTGGAGSATVTPTATDEQYVGGGASDATPTYFTVFLAAGANTGTQKFQGGARGTSPYGWWYAAAATPAGAIATGLAMDPTTGGSSSDPDPVAWIIHQGGTSWNSALLNVPNALATDQIQQAAFFNVAKTQWNSVCASCPNIGGGNIGGSTNAGSVNPFNGNVDLAPVAYMRVGAAGLTEGFKGWSTNMRFICLAKTNFVDTAATKQWICVSNVWLFWDGTTTPTN